VKKEQKEIKGDDKVSMHGLWGETRNWAKSFTLCGRASVVAQSGHNNSDCLLIIGGVFLEA
jgi:hypothetical protein